MGLQYGMPWRFILRSANEETEQDPASATSRSTKRWNRATSRSEGSAAWSGGTSSPSRVVGRTWPKWKGRLKRPSDVTS
jgi:hypothetical protein